MSERFAVRWFNPRTFFGMRQHGFAVFCDGKRITLPFPSLKEAEQHAKRIAELYQRWGW